MRRQFQRKTVKVSSEKQKNKRKKCERKLFAHKYMQMINELKLKEVFKNCTNVNKCNKKKMFSNVTELLVIIPPGDV